MKREGKSHDYEIRVDAHLSGSWAYRFEGLTLCCLDAGRSETVISGPLDQAALHGVLATIRDLNLTLISVKLIEERCDS
jgi:hypothetical protein